MTFIVEARVTQNLLHEVSFNRVTISQYPHAGCTAIPSCRMYCNTLMQVVLQFPHAGCTAIPSCRMYCNTLMQVVLQFPHAGCTAIPSCRMYCNTLMQDVLQSLMFWPTCYEYCILRYIINLS